MSGVRLQDRNVVITGGGSGIGQACARLMAAEGAIVTIADRDLAAAERTARSICSSGFRCEAYDVDVTVESQLKDLMTCADGRGGIDVVLAAAGVFQPRVGGHSEDWSDPSAGRVSSQDLAVWDETLAVNLRGTMLTLRSAIPHLSRRGAPPSIITIASGAAFIPIAGRSAYCVSKAGVWMLTKCVALELADQGVRVNCIAPGHILSPMTAELFGDPEVLRITVGTIPLGRLGTPEDVAGTALFLSGDDSRYMTGKILFPDGGLFTGG